MSLLTNGVMKKRAAHTVAVGLKTHMVEEEGEDKTDEEMGDKQIKKKDASTCILKVKTGKIWQSYERDWVKEWKKKHK